MYKMLIVDDEYNICDGIANSIPWDSIGVEVVGTAMDGVEALQKAELLSPDIVITDVNMDNMDGLELSEVLRQEHPDIKIIIVSGYDEFEYVRRALELRVYSYVMKPVQETQLMEIVRDITAEIAEERKLKEKINSMELDIERNKPVLRERFLYDLLYGNIESRDEFLARREFLRLEFGKAYYTCLFVSIIELADIQQKTYIRKMQSLSLGILEVIRQMMGGNEIWPLAGGFGNLTLLIGGGEEHDGENHFYDQLAADMEKVIESISKFLGISVLITIGGIYSDVFMASRSFREASLAAEHQVLAGEANIVNINDLFAEAPRYISPVDKEKLLLKNFLNADEEKVFLGIKEIFSDMIRQNCQRSRILIEIIGLWGELSRKAMDAGINMYHSEGGAIPDPYQALEQCKSVDAMETWFRDHVLEAMHCIRKQRTSSIKNVIKLANDYMMNHFDDPNLSLITISAHLKLSPSYFSRLYKKETGAPFSEALAGIRLEKAMQMLKHTNERLAVVSKKVGYPNTKYFCTLFKKRLGVTPIEYREE